MAETLVCILLITSSVRESNVVYRWPDDPKSSPRLTRPLPDNSLSISLLDNPWRASNDDDVVRQQQQRLPPTNDFDYAWPRPHLLRPRCHSTLSSHSTDSSLWQDDKDPVPDNQYNHILGFDSVFLARMLCPHESMSHQKFELVVDDLAFIGHPVSADSDGNWSFKSENIRSRENTPPPEVARDRSHSYSSSALNWLQTFHLVLVLDVPDPSSSASGNMSKYFNILYEQIAFTLTAVLYQEQVLSNFVERECDYLISLRESSISRGEPYSQFSYQALGTSSIAPVLKTLFEAIKSSSVAYLTINFLPLELQLPPHLDTLLLHNQNQEEQEDIDPVPLDFNHSSEDEAYHALEDVAIFNWGQDMSTGWKLPMVAPWKTLLLLDVDSNGDILNPHQQQLDTQEDKNLAEGLVRFLETVSVTMSLAETATLLDWDLETQVYPIVKWLVLHRRAKVVDVVHPGLRTVFALRKFHAPLSELTKCFQSTFSHPSIPQLPLLLSQISLSLSKPSTSTAPLSHPHLTQPDSHAHFFASVVKSKDLIPMYHDVVLWMMKRDLLVVLHLRVRIVATRVVKVRVKEMRERWIRRRIVKRVAEEKKARERPEEVHGGAEADEVTRLGSVYYDFHNVPRNGVYRRHNPKSKDTCENLTDEGHNEKADPEGKDEEEEGEQSDDEYDSGWDTSLEEAGEVDIDDLSPSIIYDPGKATPLERCWLAAMSVGKEPEVERRFELINQHFDGKRSDDEILYRAEITRKQLREVLHHYEEYLQIFLHPS